MSKKILIPGWSMSENSFGVTKPYLEYFSQFGQVEILTPRKDIVECDLLVLPGGADANSYNYDEVPGFFNSNIDTYKEYFLKQNLPQYIENKTPIFGICLGMQNLNIFFKGKLTQNLLYHSENSNPRSELVHGVHYVTGVNENELFYNKKVAFKVNSLHHQGIYYNQLGEGLEPVLVSSVDNLIEAFRHKDLPISAIQFHTEEVYDAYSINEINKLLNDKRD